jgi:hypothetical protein
MKSTNIPYHQDGIWLVVNVSSLRNLYTVHNYYIHVWTLFKFIL